jgi:hypothetical protein
LNFSLFIIPRAAKKEYSLPPSKQFVHTNLIILTTFYLTKQKKMDDATTAFATACAVIAASTGMVLCFAPKSVNDAVVDDEPVTNEKKATLDGTEEKADNTATNEEPTKEEITEPVLSEETVVDEPKEEVVAPVVNEDVPEQRPVDSATTTTTPKKRRFIRDRSNRVVEPKSQKVKSSSVPRKWLWQRPNKNSSSVHVGQEV